MHPRPTVTLLHLNDDCMEEICKYFNIPEALRALGLLGSRFDDHLCRRIARLKSYTTSTRRLLEDPIPTPCLKILGSQLLQFELTAGYALPDEMVLRHVRPVCEGAVGGRMRHLSLRYITFNQHYLKCLHDLMPQLVKLELNHCHLEDEHLQSLLSRSHNLELLNVAGNWTLKGEVLLTMQPNKLRTIIVEAHSEWSLNTEAFQRKFGHIKLVFET